MNLRGHLLFAALGIALVACAHPAPSPAATAPVAAPANDLVVTTSAHDHAETVRLAVAAIEARGLTLVQQVDHAAAARTAGLELEPTTVLVFGNPQAGTPLMQAAPTIALDLPLRVLVWEHARTVRVAYHAPAAVAAAHGLADHPMPAKLAAALAAIVDAATR